MNKFEGRPTCSHCNKKGHEESQCWKLHPKLQPREFKDKGKKNIVPSTHQDLGSDSRYESKIMAI
jgi:hypothetical protein